MASWCDRSRDVRGEACRRGGGIRGGKGQGGASGGVRRAGFRRPVAQRPRHEARRRKARPANARRGAASGSCGGVVTRPGRAVVLCRMKRTAFFLAVCLALAVPASLIASPTKAKPAADILRALQRAGTPIGSFVAYTEV